MADQNDIAEALDKIPAGTEVAVQMKDGTEGKAVVIDADGTSVLEQVDADSEGNEQVDLDEIEHILIEDSTEGPELE